MAGKFEKLYLEAMQRVRNYERVRDAAASEEFLKAALRVINSHNLAQEFVDEISRPKPKE